MSVSVKITGSIKGLKAALDDGVKSVKSFGGKVSSALKGANAVLATVGAGFAFKGMVDQLDNLSKRSRSLGLTAEELQSIEYAARSANAPMEMIDASFGKLAKTITDATNGNKQATDNLLKLGLTAESFAGKSTYQSFELIVKSINDIPDATNRTSAALAVFGEQAAKSMAFFSDFQQNVENFKSSGKIIDDEAVRAAEEFNQAVTDITQSLQAIVTRSGAIQALAWTLKKVADGIEEVFVRAQRLADKIYGIKPSARKQAGDIGYNEEREKAREKIFRQTGVWEVDGSQRLEREIESQRQKEAEKRKAEAEAVRREAEAKKQAEAEAKAKAEAEKAAKAKSSPIKEAVQKAMEVGGTEVNATSLARIGGGYGRLDAYQSTMQNAIKSMKTNTETMASAVADIKANGISLRA